MAFNIAYATDGSPWVFPTMPVPLSDEGLILLAGEKIPHKGILVDNILISGDFNGRYEGCLGATLVWTVDDTDINASVNGFIGATVGCWYDSVNDRLYVFAVDTGTAPDTYYTAFITLETGAVTNVGNTQVTVDPTSITGISSMTVGRTAIDTGNFTLTFTDRIIVLNESTGAEVSNVASVNTTDSNAIGSYTTLDGTIHLLNITQFTAGIGVLRITRNKNTIFIPITDSLFGAAISTAIVVIPWGDKVKLYTNTISNSSLIRTFLRVEFDAWLAEMATHGGIV